MEEEKSGGCRCITINFAGTKVAFRVGNGFSSIVALEKFNSSNYPEKMDKGAPGEIGPRGVSLKARPNYFLRPFSSLLRGRFARQSGFGRPRASKRCEISLDCERGLEITRRGRSRERNG